jgi:ribosomal protein L11 methyltransferase
MTTDGDSWKITLPCTKAEAEAIAENNEPVAYLPVLLTREPDPTRPDAWVIEAYFDSEPDSACVAALRQLVPSAAHTSPILDHIPGDDWITLSQQGIEPVSAGRFYVHTALHADMVPPDAIAFQIEASRAFGTGQHETTAGCLRTLDQLRSSGARFQNIADIGTGTGLLAFAAHRLWPSANVIASDIDPVAIEIALENAALNDIPMGVRPGTVELITAAGMLHRRLRRRAPYDLIIANILAGPLIDLAPVLSAALEPGGVLILAGLLDHQADAVANSYRRQGLRLGGQVVTGEWPSLRMIKRKRIGPRRPV